MGPGRPTAAATVRLVATGAPAEGRGHVARALALGEGLRSRGLAVELAFLRGALTGREADRAATVGIAVASDPEAGDAAVVVVDLPDPDEPVRRPAASRLAVFDDGDRFSGAADLVIQPSLPTWSGPGRAGRVLAGYQVIPLAGRIRELAAVAPPVAGDAELARRAASVVVCFGGSMGHHGRPWRQLRRADGRLAGRAGP